MNWNLNHSIAHVYLEEFLFMIVVVSLIIIFFQMGGEKRDKNGLLKIWAGM